MLSSGLSSRNPLVLECENDDDFQALHDNQMEIHQPATPAEEDLVDQMVAARWRILRLQSIESALLDRELRQKQQIERNLDSGRSVQLSQAYTSQANDASRCESRFLRMYQPQASARGLGLGQSTQPAAPEPTQPEPAAETQSAERIFDIKPRAAIISNAPSDVSHASNAGKVDAEACGAVDSPASILESAIMSPFIGFHHSHHISAIYFLRERVDELV